MKKSPLKKLILSVFALLSLSMVFMPWMGIWYGKSDLSRQSFERNIRQAQAYMNTVLGGVSLFGLVSPEEQQFIQEMMPLVKRSMSALEDSGISPYEMTEITVRFTSLVRKNRSYASEVLGSDTDGVIGMLTGSSVFLIVLLALTALFCLLAVRSIWKEKGKGFRIAFLLMQVVILGIVVLMITVFNSWFRDGDPSISLPRIMMRPYFWFVPALFFAMPAGFHERYLSLFPGWKTAPERTVSVTEPERIIPSEPMGTWVCTACGYPNGIIKNFCENCGAKRPVTCPYCGKDTPAGSKFCSACGNQIIRTDQ